ncbi:hypothetical protein BZA05DRAFT_418067 [Tricharina praecox]|uniref:uncharacterized protein n=1 Tax=Tricharina praecox TaxID=43433 RepID=UPI00221F253E|nr:uncharacterized protein BZA05DRAFT_418067 [Tricharina praecox]KAI5854020.1 hypothetical protein BZA05DRAFT_418067 [Tricharina praecox]
MKTCLPAFLQLACLLYLQWQVVSDMVMVQSGRYQAGVTGSLAGDWSGRRLEWQVTGVAGDWSGRRLEWQATGVADDDKLTIAISFDSLTGSQLAKLAKLASPSTRQSRPFNQDGLIFILIRGGDGGGVSANGDR